MAEDGGMENNMCEVIHIYVGENQPSPCFATIGEAISWISRDYTPLTPSYPAPHEAITPAIIHIAPGTYREKLVLERPCVTLEGSGADDTVLVYGDYALQILEDGSKRGTFRTATLRVHTHDVTLRHMTVENDAGCGRLVGQAIALYADGDRLFLEHCRLIGSQDTLFTAPLPQKEAQPGGFTGPGQNLPRVMGRQYYKHCYIQGDVDFIFGSGICYFEDCEIFAALPKRLPGKALTDSGSTDTLPPPPRPRDKNSAMCSIAVSCWATVPRPPYIWAVPGVNMPARSFWSVIWMPISTPPDGLTGARSTDVFIMANTTAPAPAAKPASERIFPVS